MSLASNPGGVALRTATAFVRIPATIAKRTLPLILLMTLVVGLNHGAIADTRGDAHIDEQAIVEDIDYSENSQTPIEREAEGSLPGWLHEQSEPNPWVQRGMNQLMLAVLTVAEEIALITYDHAWIQAWWVGPLLQLATFGYIGWMLYESGLKHLSFLPWNQRGDVS